MKMKEFVIQVRSVKESLKDFADTYKNLSKGDKIKPVEKLTFVDIDTFRKFATSKRIELLKVIKEKKPRSIKELEHLTKRDYKAINIDLNILQELNLIEIDKKDYRSVPKIKYDSITVKIPLKC
jgi:predicted transcriptional regulator